MPASYPEIPITFGDHIRKKRMEVKLLQREVASIIGVTEDCITLWEKNHSVPQIKHFPKIIDFLGYNPLEIDESTFGGRLKFYRIKNGFSNKKLGQILNVNGSTILAWEGHRSVPKQEHLKNIEKLLKGSNE